MIRLGRTFTLLRLQNNLSQRAAAKQIGISNVHLCRIERGHAEPSWDVIDKAREVYGIDPYVYAWAKFGDVAKLPAAIRKASIRLTAALDQYLAHQRDA